MRLGLGIGGSIADVADLARSAEKAGFESVWTAELTRSSLVQAAAAICATRRIRVGTAVTLAFPRSPTIAAMEAWDLDELSGGRFLLGLGTQVKRVLEGRFSVPFEHPAPKLADYALAVRDVWAANRGEDVRHEGRFYQITMPTFHGPAQPGRPDVPILFAAVGPLMARTAGTVADGLIGHPLASPRYISEVVVPAVSEGLVAAGRETDACPITATAIVSVGENADAAGRAARLQIAFYATTRTYLPILQLHDRASIQGELRRAFVRRDHDRMADLIDDDFLDAVAISGRPDELRDRLSAWSSVPGLARVILAAPWYGMSPGAERRSIEQIAGVFAAA
ncbi:MAG TPA: LLM class flavin-dependent oxidoreductase [Candidatus Acidoferrum sp.]|nr:LLM class flavin-dependent oxidoreductase [Candidatus Acidoferrum sp.]